MPRDQFVWTSPEGTSIDLTDEDAGYVVTAKGTRGLRSVSYSMSTSSYANLDGVKVDAIKVEANTPTLGLHVYADDEDDLTRKIRGLVRAMRPRQGVGKLTVNYGRGGSRSLFCYVTDGLEGDEDPAVTMPGRWWKVALKLFAPSPWWEGDPRVIEVGLGATRPFFPITPVRLGASTVEGLFAVDLTDSDAPSYPVWTVTGPGDSLILANQTTGRAITVNARLDAGQTMIINTKPGEQSVRRGDGRNLMGGLDSDPSLWPLIEGRNSISAELVGASGQSGIRGVYVPLYAGI